MEANRTLLLPNTNKLRVVSYPLDPEKAREREA